MNPFHEEDNDVLIKDDVKIAEPSFLIVHNDEENTFDWVVKCFMEVLKHTDDQAEQLSYIIHYRGKATVKTADFSELQPYRDALCLRGLSAEIEGKSESTRRS